MDAYSQGVLKPSEIIHYGEAHTPRGIIRSMVQASSPRLTETIHDPACGTSGFLSGAFAQMVAEASTEAQRDQHQNGSGGAVNYIPPLLHGLESPAIADSKAQSSCAIEKGHASDRRINSLCRQKENTRVSVSWPFLEIFPEKSQEIQLYLHKLFSQNIRRKNEADTMRMLIRPILVDILGFPDKKLNATICPPVYHERQKAVTVIEKVPLIADLVADTAIVIEAKSVKTNLLSNSNKCSNFSNPIDQAVTYLDKYNVHRVIITNGWNWYLFERNPIHDFFAMPGGINYFGLNFRLDTLTRSHNLDVISKFFGLFNWGIFEAKTNSRYIAENHVFSLLHRKLYGQYSNMYVEHFDDTPLKGPGSGFTWTEAKPPRSRSGLK